MLARLTYNRDKYEILCKEIRGAIKEEGGLMYEKLSELTYLNAVIEEGLRIHPPVPTGLLRTVPKEGDTVDGFWVPGGVCCPAVVSGQLNFVRGLKRTNQIVNFERNRHMIDFVDNPRQGLFGQSPQYTPAIRYTDLGVTDGG
jgi:hypothetical protein